MQHTLPPVLARRHVVLGALAATGLMGCQSLPSAPVQPQRFDLGAAQPLQAAPSVAAAHGPLMAVVLAPMQAPLEEASSTAIRYRLVYAEAQVLRAYNLARWSLPPVQLVQQRLREHLAQGQRVVLVAESGQVTPSWQGRPVPVLRLTLESLSHVFSSPQSSVGHVRVRATLVDPLPEGDALRAQQVLEAQLPAASANVEGGVAALAAAVDAVGQQLVQWLAQQQAAAPAR